MSFITPSPQDCCRPCPEETTTTVPGPQGEPGEPGADGTDGINAYTALTAQFTMPAEGDDVTAEVAESSWAVVGQIVFLGADASAAKGWFRVMSKPSATQIILTNLADTATSAYIENSIPGTIFPIATAVGPGGLQGPQGEAGTSGAPVDATYITQTPSADLSNEQALSLLATGLMRSTTGTGVVDIVALDTTSGGVAPNDGALVAGNVAFGTATGIETKTAAATRNALGLAKGIADTNTPQVDDAGGLTAGELLRATASGIESISNATAAAQLGITGGVGALIVCQNQTIGTDAGGITAGAWTTVPLNVEVTDTGGDCSLAGDTLTLAAGTYRIRWTVPMYAVDEFQTRLVQNVTVVYGTNAFASTTDTTGDSSFGWARLTVTAGATLKLEAYSGATNVANGFGLANAFGGTQVYATIELEKEL